MKILAKYIHGSEDSTDIDVHYVVNELPSLSECKIFCSQNKDRENRNLIVIDNGVVIDCYKGTIDEVNNGLLHTYHMHNQSDPLLINTQLKRNKVLKYVRGVRTILSHLSRSMYRIEIKHALTSCDWQERLEVLNTINLTNITYDNLNNNMSKYDILKVIAFQVGQMLALYDNVELYTKKEISEYFPKLEIFLYRREPTITNLNTLTQYLQILYNKLNVLNTVVNGQYCTFCNDNITIDLKTEKQQ